MAPEIVKPPVEPRTIVVDGEELKQRQLSTKTVKQLINVRQKDESILPTDNQSWLISHAFYGDDKHMDVVDEAIPWAELGDYFTNILEFNRLLKTGPAAGELTATGETEASSTSPTSTVA